MQKQNIVNLRLDYDLIYSNKTNIFRIMIKILIEYIAIISMELLKFV